MSSCTSGDVCVPLEVIVTASPWATWLGTPPARPGGATRASDTRAPVASCAGAASSAGTETHASGSSKPGQAAPANSVRPACRTSTCAPVATPSCLSVSACTRTRVSTANDAPPPRTYAWSASPAPGATESIRRESRRTGGAGPGAAYVSAAQTPRRGSWRDVQWQCPGESGAARRWPCAGRVGMCMALG